MKIAITGHRPNKLDNDYDLKSPLIQAIKNEILCKLIELDNINDKFTLITGMALGIDTLFAQIAIEHNIPFIAAIPFKGQESIWLKQSKLIYYNILEKASKIYIVNEDRYAEFKEFNNYIPIPIGQNAISALMQQRNIWMVDNCDKLISVWDGTSGGTANCVKYALSKGFIMNRLMKADKEIYQINPNEIRTELKKSHS